MSRVTKLYMRVASAPATARFEDVVSLAEAEGFVLKRRHGSHLVLRHSEKSWLRLTLQPDQGQAKEYQVKDLLSKIDHERLWRW